MFLDCPKCETKFLINLEQLGDKGRKVRCGNCNFVWHQDPPAPEIKQIVEEVKQEQQENLQKAAEEKAAGIEPSLPIVIQIKHPSKWLKIAALVLLALNLLTFIVFNKETIGQTAFYDLIGDYDTTEVAISNAVVTNSTQSSKSNKFFLSLTVENNGNKSLSMPAYSYAILDKQNKLILKPKIYKTKQSLDGGENFTFRAITVEDATKNGKYIVVDIGNPAEISSRW